MVVRPNRPLSYLVTGVSGQGGFFTARYFLKRGARVVGVSRTPVSKDSPHLLLLSRYAGFRHFQVSEYTSSAITHLVSTVKPERFLHCAGFRDLPATPDEVKQCFRTNCDLLEMFLGALADHAPDCRVLFLSSAEIFSKDGPIPVNEQSPINPSNEYGRSKVVGMQILRDYMQRRGIFGASAICFNHDSFLSPRSHLVRLVPRKLVMVKRGLMARAAFFDVEMRRDWSHAKDFARAFDLMLEQAGPKDFVVASGKATTLKDYILLSCQLLGLNADDSVEFRTSAAETSYDRVADSSQIQALLGWQPRYAIEQLCSEMIWLEQRNVVRVT